MVDVIELSAPDLAAMLCSRVCHDLINPVGAIGNGLSALEDPNQAEMQDIARQLIGSASNQALAKLEFARLAYGASSTQGTQFDTRECERVASLLFGIEKAELDWAIEPVMVPKTKGKLVMNMLLIAVGGVPRGGMVKVEITGTPENQGFLITASSDPDLKQRTMIPSGVEPLLAGNPEEGVDARGIQPFYTGLLARLSDMDLKLALDGSVLTFAASPKS